MFVTTVLLLACECAAIAGYDLDAYMYATRLPVSASTSITKSSKL